MLKISNLRFEILREIILRDFSLELNSGEVKTLFGPSGCGKTTLLRLICGLDDPKSGRIENEFKKIGFLFQENRLLNNLTALENISIFMSEPDLERIHANALNLGLEKGDLNKFPSQLSGGMAKRVAFLRLILSDCDLALLDEPFVGLDRDLREICAGILSQKVENNELAALLVTHDRFEAVRLSHEIIDLEPKQMRIRRVIRLQTPLRARDAKFEESVVAREFKGVMYYE